MSTISSPISSLPYILTRLLFSLYLLTLFTGYSSGAINLPDNFQINKTTQHVNRQQAILVKSGFSKLLFDYIDENVNQLEQHGVTSQCVNSLKHFNASLKNGDPWALKMLDASGRMPSDITGNGYLDLGSFENCLQLSWLNSSGSTETGQHCLTSVLPVVSEPGTAIDLFVSSKVISDYDTSFSLRIGFCIPSGCQKNDLHIIANKALEPFSWTVPRVDSCQIRISFTDKLIKASSLQKFSLAFFATFILLVICATWKDVTSKQNTSGSPKQFADKHWVRSFSLRTNWKSMVEPDEEMSKSPTITRCGLTQHVIVLHFHALIWPVISGAIVIYAVGDPLVIYKDSQILKYMVAEWFMEGLFAYAGLCKSCEFWRKTNSKTSIWQIINTIVVKMLKLTCLFAIMIGVEMIVPLFASGPLNPLIAEKNAEICSKTYTANIFFYQNYIGSLDKVCIAHSWSLAAEYQMVFFLAGLIILYKRYPKVALSLNAVGVIGGLINVGRVYYQYDIPVHPISRGFDPGLLSKWIESVYLPSSMKFWLYITPACYIYIIMTGIQAKYITENRNKFKLGMYYLAPFIMLLPFIRGSLSIPETPMFNAGYILIYRIFTGIFYACLIFHNADEFREYFSYKPKDSKACENNNNNNSLASNGNHGKIIDDSVNQTELEPKLNKTLKYISGKTEYKILHILTVVFRSTYCVHVPVLLWYYSQHRYPVLTISEWAFHTFSSVFLSIAAGIVFHLFILGPYGNLTEAIKSKDKQSESSHLKDE
ncbi:uncharacterized protein LOC107367029 [Tetranychus urticae]|uniref:Nose resistant-to-fluoxetine protein N-terminal domain-containing protein n=1 Tax=Tetranychus urticae TaxID=32264 RepID=T1KSR6_TETUR|nr:uncharacterized protein LOC107367029 [Tetranychus urticae]